jgi:hypothetical protein
MVRGKRKTCTVRRKQKLGAGWLLLPLVAGLPIAVFLAWREEKPQMSAPMPHEALGGDSAPAVVEALPGTNPREESPAQPLPTTDAGVQGVPPPSDTPAAPAEAVLDSAQAATSPSSMAETSPQSGPPPPQKLDWAEIATRPARWPAHTRTKIPVEFPITVGGQRSGSTRVPSGASVRVVKILEDGVEIAFAEYSTKVPFDQTTLAEQMGNGVSDSPADPAVPDRAAPLPKVPAPPKANAGAPAHD